MTIEHEHDTHASFIERLLVDATKTRWVPHDASHSTKQCISTSTKSWTRIVIYKISATFTRRRLKFRQPPLRFQGYPLNGEDVTLQISTNQSVYILGLS
jgi:hypothetical protein